MGAFAIGEGIDQLHQAIDAASDLNESVSKSSVVFGQGQGQLLQWADKSATAFGESKQQAIEAAATFGNFFEAMGVGQPKAQQMSESVIQLAGDLASFNNADPTQVLEDLRSGLSGQVEPLRKYGIDLSDATLKQEAMREGLKINNGVLTAGQKAQVAYSLIMAQTKTAQGDFARTSGGLANQQRILSAQWDNAKASLGAGLLPIMTKVVSVLANWVPKIVDFVQHNQTLVTVLGLAAAAVWAVNIAMDANPISLIIIGLAALVAAVIYAWNHFSWFKGAILDVWAAAKAVGSWFAGPFVDFFKHMGDSIVSIFKGAINWVIGGFNRLNFTVPRFDTHIPGLGVVGGFTVGVGHLPLLDVGGDVLAGGLAVIHAGERVVPAAQVAPLGRGAAGVHHTFEFKGAGGFEQLLATLLARMASTGQLKISSKAVV
jgi:hypothetical protein